MMTFDSSKFNAELFLSENEESIQIPRSFVVSIDLTYPAKFHPDKEAMVDHLLRNSNVGGTQPFSLVREWKETLPSNDPKSIHEKWNYEVEPQLPGYYGITFLDIPFISDKETYSLLSPLVFAKIDLPEAKNINIAAETASLANLSRREPIELDGKTRAYLLRDYSEFNKKLFQNRGVIWEVTGVLLVFILMTWIVKLILKQKKPAIVEFKPINFLGNSGELLDQLKLQSVLQPAVVESFIVQLTNGVRDYFAKKFHVEAPKKTTQETMQALQEHPEIIPEKKEAMLAFLEVADRIKFAGYQPSLEECEQAYQQADKLLN